MLPSFAELRALDTSAHDRRKRKFDRAIDFLEDRQLEHTRSELQKRFPSAFDSAGLGQEILPITVSLTERFASEQAQSYRRPPRRYFCEGDGSETDATRRETEGLARMIDASGLDEVKLQSELVSVTVRTACEYYGIKDGALSVVLVLPQNVVEPAPQGRRNQADAYPWFVIDEGGERFLVCANDGGCVAFVGREANKPRRWVTEPEVLTMQPLTFWSYRQPLAQLIPDTDVTVAEINMEINIALSSLIDNIRFQGHAVPVKKLEKPQSAAALQRHGARFPVVLSLVEEFSLVSAATNYADQLSVLREIVRLTAIGKSLAPGDVSTDGTAPQSGFAKLVESLPKIERREERTMALARQERRIMLPRLLDIGIATGELTEAARKMRYRVEFPDVEFPRTESERAQQIETDIKHGLTTPAKILAQRDGITVEQAQAVIEENKLSAGQAGGAEMFGYHIESGAVRINEVRAKIGLAPDPEIGEMTVPELKAKAEAEAAPASPTQPGQPPAQEPRGFSFGQRIGRKARDE